VDGLARSVLHNGNWRPDLGRQRSLEVQALRAVAASLAKPDPTVRAGSDEFRAAVSELGRRLERHQARLAGLPVVRPRLRLTLPVDAADPWLVELELVDDADSSRWCTADDVWQRAPRAADLAGGDEGFATLTAAVLDTASAVAPAVPGMGELAVAHEPACVELDLETAADFIDLAPGVLDELGIDLIGPEHLVRAKVTVRGTARAAPAQPAGATLMRAGHRWVRIDPAGVRRARQLLDEQIARRSTVDAIGVLQLAAGDGADTITTADAVPVELAVDDRPGVDAGWIRSLLEGLPDERLEEAKESGGFCGELRHYQRRGLAWMQFLARLGLGGCLADAMGLGKTATTLAHLVDRPGPHLVVCPLSVVHNWEAEARRFTPGLSVVVHHGSGRSQGEPALFGLADADLVITTYGLLPRDLDALAAVDWSTVVLDEAQVIKNSGTKAAKAARRLRAAQKLALTGTPVENRLTELWSILDTVNPGLLGSQQHFRQHYASPIERNGDGEVAARLRRLTQPFVLRRTKADRRLLPDLPDKIEQVAFAQLTREQAVLYQQVVDQLLADADELEGMQRRGRVLAALTRLKQVCNHPAHALKDGSRLAGRSGKLNRFDELVAELLDVGERALVFTQFREMGDLLQLHLREQFALDVPFLHGGVSRPARERMVTEFQSGAGAPLLVVSLKAGGTGLNLTAASQVIHYDRWWNPAVEDQATDRAWRIGQQRTVHVHKLVCQGTVEERIGEIIDDKRAIADAVLGTGEAWLSELSTDELARLVALEGSPS
jgi:hypothetical protein